MRQKAPSKTKKKASTQRCDKKSRHETKNNIPLRDVRQESSMQWGILLSLGLASGHQRCFGAVFFTHYHCICFVFVSVFVSVPVFLSTKSPIWSFTWKVVSNAAFVFNSFSLIFLFVICAYSVVFRRSPTSDFSTKEPFQARWPHISTHFSKRKEPFQLDYI